MAANTKYDAVAFDLLTALVDSWTLWNDVAGSPEAGMRWRMRYLEVTYSCGTYRPYETLVREAAVAVGLPALLADDLAERWDELQPWPEAPAILTRLAQHVPLGVATNCSVDLGSRAARRVGDMFKVVLTAEAVGFYKPRPEPYRAAMESLEVPALFVAGSAGDVPGAEGVGLPVVWHNRVGASGAGGEPLAVIETLEPLPALVR
jgi:2-haloalkanoic acid dehalogenase type II